MKNSKIFSRELSRFISLAFNEDLGSGDVTTLACVPENAKGTSQLIVKSEGILAGVDLAKKIFSHHDKSLRFVQFMNDEAKIKSGDIAFKVSGSARSILICERLVLNCMQRMSGIATLTRKFVDAVNGTGVVILETRKTTPNFRLIEKWAVKIGGAQNHRFGLYDMVIIKDNHIDFCGGIPNAIQSVNDFLKKRNRKLKIEIEVRNLNELNQVLSTGNVDRIMLDNFSVSDIKKAVTLISGRYETEVSGGVNLKTVRKFAECGVNFISVGALTHQYQSLDLSLKAL